MSNLHKLNRKEQLTYQEWLTEKAAIQRAEPEANETPAAKAKRIKSLLTDFSKFCRYYFSEFMDADFGWFHLKAAKAIKDNTDLLMVAEWPREHAKSVFFDVFVPMYLKARGELSGVVLASSTAEKANGLLGDLQEQLMFNRRYINDFGPQHQTGKWDEGHFVTADGLGFWSFGRGQSPRGIREAALRPNYGVADDMDDAEIVKNEKRTDEAVDWLLGDLYGALPTKASRFIVAGNRIHKKSILAKVVGDVEEGDPKKEGVTHIKVYALENPRTRAMDMSEDGRPAWQRYTRAEITRKMNRMGYRLGLRELFHQHIIIGKIFKEEHLPWAELPPLSACEKLVTYCDPSYRDTKKNDFKFIVLMGKNGKYFDIYAAFGRQCSPADMVRGHYELAACIPGNKVCRHYMEANFIQDIHLKTYDQEAEDRGFSIAIRGDRRKKPDKVERIEDISPYTERGKIRFNIEERTSPDMQELRNQFLGFPDAAHDDGPDAVEGAIYKLNKPGSGKSAGNKPLRCGKYNSNNKRRVQ